MTLPASELAEWLALFRIEPFGALHEELMAGQICAIQANSHRDPERKPDPWTASDFFPGLKRHCKAEEAILLDDPEAQSALLANSLFAGLTRTVPSGRQDDR